MKEQRKLILELIDGDIDKPHAILKVSEQTHRGQNFVPRSPGNIFIASNGLKIKSMGCPEWKPELQTLYVRGSRRDYDEINVTVERSYLLKIGEAIKEYNRKFGIDVPMSSFGLVYEWDELFIIE